MRTVGIGIQSFEEMRRDKRQFYVDKTDFLRDWYYKNDSVTLITRPRRFGKTLTMDMVNCFFSMAYEGRTELFQDLNVSKDKDLMNLQGTLPVISLSFASVKAKSFHEFLISITGIYAGLFSKFSYLADSPSLTKEDRELFAEIRKKNKKIPNDENELLAYEERITSGLQWLSEWLYSHHKKKVIILLDEYDKPLQEAFMHHYYDECISVIRTLFLKTFKENEYLSRGIITGITRITKESLFSDLNNLVVCSVLSGGYDTVFGFTSDEMEKIITEFELENSREVLRAWYDGFTIGKETDIYNPWSVINYLANRHAEPRDYWAQSGGVGLLDQIVRRGKPQLQDQFQVLLRGGCIAPEITEDLAFPDLYQDDRAVWSLLVSAGYLKPQGEKKLTFTNYEAKQSLEKMVRNWFFLGSEDYIGNFVKAMLSGSLSQMNEEFSKIVLICASSFDSGIKPSLGSTQPENYFHGLATGLLVGLLGKYDLTSNSESGLGRYDLVLEPVDRKAHPYAYILEFKVFSQEEGDKTIADTAKRAKRQIEEKKYDTKLLSRGFGKGEILKFGVGFRGKEALIV